jgi:hypothetical protein
MDYNFQNMSFTQNIEFNMDEQINRDIDQFEHKFRTDELNAAFLPTNIENAFLSQQNEQYMIFQEKNKNYGMNNISGDEDVDLNDPESKKEALQGLYFRMRDKMARFKQLIETNSQGSNDESLNDTLNDLSNYSNIAIIVNKDNWK